MTHDVVLRGGTVLDGTGAPARLADVAISGDRIAEVGTITAGATRVVDVSGLVVCPGFIDLHSHADFTVFGAPDAVTQVTQGVTTLVTGNCGFSPFPISPEYRDDLLAHRLFAGDDDWDWSTAGEYADAVDRLPLGVNLAAQVGHGALRIAAMGLADRPPTDAELDRMRALLRESAAGGAVGFSTGLIYAPGTFADTAEVLALGAEAAAAGLLYSTHMRGEGGELAAAVEEALTVARRTGVRLEISHLKAAGRANWGTVGTALAAIEDARRDGVDVSADQYPYTAASTTLTASLPTWAMDGGVPALLDRLADPAESARITAELDAAYGRTFWPEATVVADTPDGPYLEFVGRTVMDLAADRGLSPGAALVELLRGQRAQVSVIHHSMAEEDVRLVMTQPFVAVASDGWVLECPGAGRPHPRSLGTFTRVLGHYTRDEQVLDLPAAVRKMTSLPAWRLGWTDRGVVRTGAVADLVAFDPDAVTDNATFDEPWQLSTGVEYTLLAGVPVLDGGRPTGIPAGRVLRR
ncbi:MAG TPA: D-aminoacylase [Jiangellaceae bacterium]|nr:D-aminoacylase [Jiangellaceae bacterium]